MVRAFSMRLHQLLLVSFFLGLAFHQPLRAQSNDPSELFLNAYMAVQQGERLEHDGSLKQAVSKYRYAASLLEQVQQKYPNWQPLIVEYRKKRTSENIARIDEQVAGQAPAGPGGVIVEPEVPMPEKSPMEAGPAVPERTTDDPGIKSRVDQLQTELRESKTQLRTVQQQKEQIAGQLDDVLKQLDKSKVSAAELRSRLQQAQEAARNAPGESDAEGGQKWQRQIAQLQEQLAEVQADREAADEVNSDYARRMAKVRKSVSTASKESEAALARLKELEGKFATASKVAKELDDAKNQLAKVMKENQASQESSSDAEKKLAAAQKQVAAIGQDRDAARKQAAELQKKVDEAQKRIAAVGLERDTIAKQRDQAVAELAKARESQKRVDKLIADNAALAQKLGDAETTIKNFNSTSPKRDEELANLRKEVGETKTLLAATQKQNTEYKDSIAGLQKQLDASKSELAAMQAGGATAEEKKKYAEENDLLRGIVLRQLKEQARREQARKLVLNELQRLQVQSTSLMQQIDYLGQPVVKLTDQEKALFKQPQIEIADTDSSSAMEFSIAAPKADEVPKPIPSAPPAQSSPSPAITGVKPAASVTPAEVAKLTGAASPAPMTSVVPAKTGEESLATKGGAEKTSPLPQIETALSPNVPAELLTQAHDAKDIFERGQYREAEKIYERMLTQAPNNVYILSNLGVVEFRQNKMKLAEEKFKKAIAVAPDDSFSHRTLGIVYYQQGKYDEAVQSLTKAIAINTKDSISHNYLGIAASQKGWQEAALKELETAIALDPNYADANFNLAVIYATMQPPNKELARKYYKRAIELGAEPDSALEQLIK